MNWTNSQTYNEAPTEAFETLCNQLFENWCKETYDNELSSFRVVNGAGGDGGVESYAVLSDKKWSVFRQNGLLIVLIVIKCNRLKILLIQH